MSKTWLAQRTFIDTSCAGILLKRVYREWDLDTNKPTGEKKYEQLYLNKEILNELFEKHSTKIIDLTD